MKTRQTHLPVVSLILSFMVLHCAQGSEPVEKINNAPFNDNSFMNPSHFDTATFGMGCFWCSEAIFQNVNGVSSVTSGYSGGQTANPTYEEVCKGLTGHAEVVQVVFDTEKTNYQTMLKAFWLGHDPTTLNRQGADEGTQYRSAIFYHNQKQKDQAEEYKHKLNESGIYDSDIVTEIVPFKSFFIAENYHRNYFNNNGNAPYCRLVITPKLEKFKKVFSEKPGL